jgi:autotransporter-associated beta strand protein
LSGANSFTGGVTISSQWPLINYGNLSVGSSNALNSTAGQENYVTFQCIGNLTLNGYSLTLSGVSNMTAYAGSNAIQNASSTNVTLTVGNAQNRNSAYSGVIKNGTGSGTLSLTKAGTGTLTLSNTNQYTGATTVLAGTLEMTNVVKSATWAVSNSAILKVNGPLDLSSPSRTLTIATGGGTSGLFRVNGNLTLGGALTVSATNAVTTQMTLAECMGGGTISGGVGSFSSTSLPANTLLKISNDSTKLLLIKKPTGTMISVF